MKILFLGTLYPRERETEVQEVSSYFDFAGNTLQWTLVSGFERSAEVKIITTPNIKSAKKDFKTSRFCHKSGTNDVCVGVTSSTIKKKLVHGRRLFRIFEKEEFVPDVIFIYSYGYEHLQAAALIKRKHPHVKIVIMVTDLLEFMGASNSNVYRLLKWIEKRLCNHYISHYVDGIVLLSENMRERLPIGAKPYIVIEGIFNDTAELPQVPKETEKVILYTGNLDGRYGISDLLQAFEKTTNPDLRLWLCGSGDSIDDIKLLECKDNRVHYWGIVDRAKALELQKRATLLVNPRHSNEEYTKYSFPSKTMEYMASGTPTLMCRLSCLPQEYQKHLYFFEDEDVEGMSRRLEEVCSKPQEELDTFGLAASEFILKNKNQEMQCKKIIEFMESLSN